MCQNLVACNIIIIIIIILEVACVYLENVSDV